MITVNSLADIPSLPQPIALAIGTFDGVHSGHQYLFQELKKHGTAVVLTFSNHPAEVIHSTHVTPLCTLEERLKLFEACGIDLAIVVPFTAELAKTPYDTFLKQLHRRLPFSTLVRGKGSVLGYKAQGTEEKIKELAHEMNFKALYLPVFLMEGEAVSSRKIRELLKTGNVKHAHRLLGRG